LRKLGPADFRVLSAYVAFPLLGILLGWFDFKDPASSGADRPHLNQTIQLASQIVATVGGIQIAGFSIFAAVRGTLEQKLANEWLAMSAAALSNLLLGLILFTCTCNPDRTIRLFGALYLGSVFTVLSSSLYAIRSLVRMRTTSVAS
jgi:hypothetical protein